MKRIPLYGKNGLGKYAIVSDEDFEELSKYRWRVQKDSITKGLGYVCKGGTKNRLYMHRKIMGDKDGFVVDHINRNTLDNRRENLRHLTPRNSCMNRRIFGIGAGRRGNKWRSQISINGIKKHLGLYATKDEAHQAYLTALAKSTSTPSAE